MSEENDTQATRILRRESRIAVVPNRRRFEASLDRILGREAARGAAYAVLHVVVQSFSGTGCVSLRILNLVGDALRAGMQDGEVAYLGEAEFAVFLRDVDGPEAGVYARDMAAAISNFSLLWEDEMLSVSASIGCVTGRGIHDGTMLLYQAIRASDVAAGKTGYKVHLVHAPDVPRPQKAGPRASGARPALA
jgi:GGDEF domain-containing protein